MMMFRTIEDIISSLQYIDTPSTRVSYIFLASLTKPFLVSDHMISFKTAFFNIFASVFVRNSFFSTSLLLFSFKTPFFRIWTHDFVRNSLFSYLITWFRSKQHFFVSDHMISLGTAFFNIFASVFVRNSFFSYLNSWFR